ncbi:MAG: glycosyltransferase [Methanosphaera sp.]|nr:glycosyltransferase [Methanosphaera sp.]
MIKLSIIMSVIESTDYLIDSLNAITKQLNPDVELLLVNNQLDEETSLLLTVYSTKDDGIRVIENNKKTLSSALNKAIIEADGEYIYFADTNKQLLESSVEKILSSLQESKQDIILFRTSRNDEENELMEKISRIVNDKAFDYEKLGKYFYKLESMPWNKVYNKEFLQENNLEFNENLIFDYENFFFKTFTQANGMRFINQELFVEDYKPKTAKKFENSINSYINTLQLEKLDRYELYNSMMQKSKDTHDNIPVDQKQLSFIVLREFAKNILNSNISTTFLENLNKENRKLFELIVISENAEEYEILERTYNNSLEVNYLKRYEKVLRIERDKLRNFNNSLVSSNSWKLTKVFRIFK